VLRLRLELGLGLLHVSLLWRCINHLLTYLLIIKLSVIVCGSVRDASLYTMTSRFVLELKHTAIHAVYASATDMLTVVSITRLWTRNPHNTRSAAVASASTVRITRPETSATHAWRAISGRRDAVCMHEMCVNRATAVATVLLKQATTPCIVNRFVATLFNAVGN